MLVDTHCHLHDPEWFTPEQSEELLEQALQADVKKIIVAGTDPTDSANAYKYANEHDGVYWTYGIHPEFANDWAGKDVSPAIKSELADIVSSQAKISNAKLVAIGEIGLDYHYDGHDRDKQIRLFEQMLQLATDYDLPVSLHIREAFADAWPILANFPQTRGVLHSFTGSKRDLRQGIERGFYIGVNGLTTYTTTPLPPLENMLLETDAPFLTPVPYRGTINSPRYVREIATYLSEKLGVAYEVIVEQTTSNAGKLFRI